MSTKAERKRKRERIKRQQRKETRRQKMAAINTQSEGNLGEMRLIIEPSDTWLFRDGKPFRAGEDHWAGSRFPPTPLTIQGVIRSKILLDSDTDLAQYAANPETTDIYQVIGSAGQNYGTLTLRGPYLARRENSTWIRYYPAPADLLCNKEHKTFCRLAVGDVQMIANWPQGAGMCPLCPPTDEVELVSGWIAAEALYAYLTEGTLPQAEQVVRIADIYTTEERIAIGLDRRVRRPRPQLLTEIGMVRLCDDWALDVEVSGTPVLDSPGYLGIGGEARAGYYEALKPDPPPAPPSPPSGRFLLYFATPAWFKNGWLPEDWGKWFSGGTVKLVAAVVNRAERIGGWDIVQGEKAMRAYVPAGSIYYFDGIVTFSGEPVTDNPVDGQIGFGQAFIGQRS
jgi:CRISPR-associated protein Cmr3